ncbi:MAG: hypothetical protein LQ340_007916, partial [Diploschistes diacapsis]
MSFLFASKPASTSPSATQNTVSPSPADTPPQQPQPQSSATSSAPASQAGQTTTPPPDEPQTLWESVSSRRSRKQLSFFFLGSTLLAFSSILTRRALVHRHRATWPLFYRPSNLPPEHGVNPAFEAFQALQIATLNVASGLIMFTSGMLWAFDISSIDDLRRKVRGGLGVDGTGRSARDVEMEFEEWLAETLQRRR